jgi:hypothetical protein
VADTVNQDPRQAISSWPSGFHCLI